MARTFRRLKSAKSLSKHEKEYLYCDVKFEKTDLVKPVRKILLIHKDYCDYRRKKIYEYEYQYVEQDVYAKIFTFSDRKFYNYHSDRNKFANCFSKFAKRYESRKNKSLLKESLYKIKLGYIDTEIVQNKVDMRRYD